MYEVWLKTNRLPLTIGAVATIVAGAAGALLGTGLFGWIENSLARLAGWLLASVSLLTSIHLARQAWRPRIACQAGELLLFLRPGRPIRVPLKIVEGFLMGQGPSFLPGQRFARMEATTIVIRLAERAQEWAKVDVEPKLGSWCGHYVTIRGAWCEPLSVDLVNRLNARLAEVQAALHAQQAAP
ncbi:MAG TPA: hypothetical protein VMV10_17870 [Pirellulales bacterium]|nr:hypothetical protein [Pirellulales bacterium]